MTRRHLALMLQPQIPPSQLVQTTVTTASTVKLFAVVDNKFCQLQLGTGLVLSLVNNTAILSAQIPPLKFLQFQLSKSAPKLWNPIPITGLLGITRNGLVQLRGTDFTTQDINVITTEEWDSSDLVIAQYVGQ